MKDSYWETRKRQLEKLSLAFAWATLLFAMGFFSTWRIAPNVAGLLLILTALLALCFHLANQAHKTALEEIRKAKKLSWDRFWKNYLQKDEF